MYRGGQALQAVYRGATKIWPAFRMVDNFTNAMGSALIWSITGTQPTLSTYGTAVEAGNGKCDGWSIFNVLTTPLSRVEHVIYHTTDRAQRNSLLIGDPSENIYLEYAVDSWILGYYNGTRWSTLTSGGAFGLTNGSVVALERTSMTRLEVTHNGNQIGVASIPADAMTGANHRKVGFTLRAAQNFFVWWRSPAIDDIRVSP